MIEKQIMTIEAYTTELKKPIPTGNSQQNTNERIVVEFFNKEIDRFADSLRVLQRNTNKKEFTFGELSKYHNIFIDGNAIRGFMAYYHQYPEVDIKIIIFWITFFLNTPVETLSKTGVKILSDAYMIIDNAIKNDACVQRFKRLYFKEDPVDWFTGTIGILDWPFGLDKEKYGKIREKYEVVMKGLTPRD